MYGSIEGVKDAFPRAAEHIKPDAEATGRLDIKESTITRYLVEFSAVVDNALYKSFVLPIKDGEQKTPAIIDLIVNNLAAYKLASRFYTNISPDENHSISALRKDANEMLKSLASGEYGLPGVPVAPSITSGDPELDELLSLGEENEIFNMEDPESWQTKL